MPYTSSTWPAEGLLPTFFHVHVIEHLDEGDGDLVHILGYHRLLQDMGRKLKPEETPGHHVSDRVALPSVHHWDRHPRESHTVCRQYQSMGKVSCTTHALTQRTPGEDQSPGTEVPAGNGSEDRTRCSQCLWDPGAGAQSQCCHLPPPPGAQDVHLVTCRK